jgi:hypothetical protein
LYLYLGSDTSTPYSILHSGNSSVSGGGSAGGSSITVTINNTAKTLTIPTSLPANGGTASYYTLGPSATWTNTWDCNAPDRIVYCDYGSSGRSVSNAPSGWTYGTLLELGHMSYTGQGGNLNLQLMWDVAHNTTNGGTLWFRGKDSKYKWGKDWCKVLTNQNSSVSGGGSSVGSSITVDIGGTSKTLTIPSTSTYTNYLNILDVRGTNHGPNSDTYPSKNVTAWFNSTGTPDSNWYAGLTLRGCLSGYTAWQICSYASTGTANNYSIYVRSGNNSTWGSWRTLLDSSNWTSYISIPTVTNYYWANVPISATSSTTTTPTFSKAIAGEFKNAGGILTVTGISGTYFTCNNDDTASIYFTPTYFKPFSAANGKLDLGVTTARWKGLYSQTGDFSGTLSANTGTNTPYSLNTNLVHIRKALTWSTSSYLYNVILLIPVLTTKNWSGLNYIDGKFLLWKTGGNVYDVININMNCVYNSLYYTLTSSGQHASSVKLCICTYNGVSYYALDLPYHANPYNKVEFYGSIKSDLTGGPATVALPLAVDYYNDNTSTILNSEIYNSKTSTLTTTIVTNVNSYPIVHHGGVFKYGSSDSYVLLGGGGHKAITDFALSSSLGNYLPLTGGTIKNGTTRNPLTIDTTNTSGAYMNFATNGTINAYVGYHPTYGAFLETVEGSSFRINNKAASFNGSMTLAGALTLSGTTSATAILRFSRTGASTWNYILWPGDSNSDCKLAFGYNNTSSACYYYMTKDAIYPVVTSTQTLGTTNNRWLGFYSNTGDFLNDVTSGTKFKASNSNGAVSILTSTNRGLYDETNGQWIIYISKDGSTVYVPKWASKGASDRPVYFNSNGIPTATTYRMAATNTTATTSVSIDSDTDTGIWYVNGTSSIIGPSDGVCISNKYSSLWISQIYQDYRTGKIAVRGKNSGTWTSWKKVAYEDDIPSVTSYYWADVPISSSPLTNTNPTFGSLIVDGLIRSKSGIIRPSASTTNAVSAITFYKGSSKSTEFNRDAVIGWFNEGGTNNNGAFYLVPYPQDTDPWATSVGLFISQTQLLFEGKTVYHSGNLTKASIGLGNVQNTAFYKRFTYVNGTEWNMAGTTNGAAFTIYAPTTAGTSGQVLTSSGGTPRWTNQSSLSVGYASSAGNADTLDTYHASSFVLKRIQTASPTGTAVGWYRCAQISSSNAGHSQNVIISLQRSYNSPQNEHYIFAISIGYNGQVSINQISGCVGGQRITKIRVVYNNSGNCYFDYYMATSNYSNSYKVEILAGDCVSYQEPTLISAADGTAVEFVPTSGMKSNYSMYAPSFYQDSDQTLKTNIQTILNSDNMPIIKEFDWKSDGTHSYGLIAQELEEKGYYELVNTDGSGSKTVNYTAALSLIVGKLQNKIKELEKEIENLKNKN